MTEAYRASFFDPQQMPSAASPSRRRARNVTGGGDWARDRLVPDAVRAFMARHAFAPFGKSWSMRSWQHVLEPLAGYLMLAERLVTDGVAYGEAWNLGPLDSLGLPVSDLAARLAARWGDGAASAPADETPGRARPRRVCYGRMRQRPGRASVAASARVRGVACMDRRVVPEAARGADARADGGADRAFPAANGRAGRERDSGFDGLRLGGRAPMPAAGQAHAARLRRAGVTSYKATLERRGLLGVWQHGSLPFRRPQPEGDPGVSLSEDYQINLDGRHGGDCTF